MIAAIVLVALTMRSPAGADPAQPSGPLELVSRFTTYYPPGQPRVINIHRAAFLLDRMLLPPGARFSLNERLGKRTRARGFVAAPSISGPIHVDSVGGGVSQVATTLYNAAFFAGLRLIAHTPPPETQPPIRRRVRLQCLVHEARLPRRQRPQRRALLMDILTREPGHRGRGR